MFNPGVPSKITPFTRKYKRLLDGSLEAFETQEKEKFTNYIFNLENESLPEEEQYPIVYEDAPYFTCELTGLSRLSFSVADDPFYKSNRAKYYPEVYVVTRDSGIRSVINPTQKKSEKYPTAFEYMQDFREPTLKINDDRKIKINLQELVKKNKSNKMILLAVKTFDLRAQPPAKGAYDRAWYRLVNEDTNQAVDYKVIKTIEKPEGFDEDAPLNPDDGEDAAKNAPSITYLAGRIFYDTPKGRWVYESFNHCFLSDKHPKLFEKLADIHYSSEEELSHQKSELERVKHRLLELQEERKAAALAAAAKKKPSKKRQEQQEEEHVNYDLPQILKSPEPKEYDIFDPKDYLELLKLHIPRPFVFGPLDFTDLQEKEQPFPADYWHDAIIETLMRSPYLPAENILVHGFKVAVRQHTLKRPSQIVKHSRFLRNMEVFPLTAPEVDPNMGGMDGSYAFDMNGMGGDDMDDSYQDEQ